jgi:hypothetical protein
MVQLLGWEEFRLSPVRLYPPAERMDRIDELVYVFELLIHGCVTQICDLIDAAQFLEYLRADIGGLHFAPAGLELVLNLVDDLLQRQQTRRPFLERFRDAAGELPPVERFVRPVTFDHPQV